jgi:hypothetical protein
VNFVEKTVRAKYIRSLYLFTQEMKEMNDKKLELVFVDKEGKFYPIDEVDSAELAKGFEKISKEMATRLKLQKEQR